MARSPSSTILLCLLAISTAMSAGCLSTTRERRARTVTVSTVPSSAAVSRVENGIEHYLGHSPVRVEYPFEVERTSFNPACYLFTALGLPALGAGAVAGYSILSSTGTTNTGSLQGTAIASGTVLGLAVVAGSFFGCRAQQSQEGERPLPSPMAIVAEANGSRVNFELRADTADAVTLGFKAPSGGSAATAAGDAPVRQDSSTGPGAPAARFSGRAQPTAYALAIGIQNYRDLPSPGAARADAEAFVRIARDTLGVPPDNIRTAFDERASKSDLEKQLLWLRRNVPSGGRIYVYFSGHGAPDVEKGSAYLMPFDGDAQFVTTSGLSLEEVYGQLSESRAADVLVFLDSCFSGAGGRSVLPPGTRPLVAVKETQPRSGKLAVFSASSGSQISGSTPSGNGLFTHHLVEGVSSGAADSDGDGRITLGELSSWVTPRVRRDALAANREQTPGVRTAGSADQFVVTAR